MNFNAVRTARDAREIIGVPALVGGSVGPIGRDLVVGAVTLDEARAAFAEQVGALVEGGIDLLVLETFPSLAEARAALAAARSVTDLPAIVALDFVAGLTTPAGESPREVVALLAAEGADVVGINCGVGPRAALDILQELAVAGLDAPIYVKPNAGLPRVVEGRSVYPSSPQYFADFALRAKDLRAAIIGGCCGTTPAHVRAMREALDGATGALPGNGSPEVATALAVRDTRGGVGDITPPSAEEPADVVDGVATLRLRDKLAAGAYVISVEIDPPRGINPRKGGRGRPDVA